MGFFEQKRKQYKLVKQPKESKMAKIKYWMLLITLDGCFYLWLGDLVDMEINQNVYYYYQPVR